VWPLVALSALLGTSLGSFAGVVADRGLRAALDPRAPRSRCAGCGRELRWWENAPIVAWLALGGRCRTCRAAIPRRLFFYECGGALTGALTTLSIVALAK